MKRILLLGCLLWAFSFNAFADTGFVQKVEIEPLQGGISFNTVTLGVGWVTMNTTEMRGRKEIMITNTSATENVYLSGVSGSTAKGTLYPRERATFKASAALHIYGQSTATGSTCEIWEIR